MKKLKPNPRKEKKMENKFFIFVISFFAVISIATVGFAAVETSSLLEGQTTIANVENFTQTINVTVEGEENIGDFSLGGTGAFTENQDDIATSTTPIRHTSSISVHDKFRWGDDPVIDVSSETITWVSVDFNVSSSTLFAIQVTESSAGATPTTDARIYIEEMQLVMTGMATRTIQMFVGTSSTQFENIGEVTGDLFKDITASSKCSLMDDVLITADGLLDATGTVFFSSGTYVPCDTGYQSATPDIRNIPIMAGEWIVGLATSSTNRASGFTSQDLLNGKVQIKYRVVK